jgi:hypothetical protein
MKGDGVTYPAEVARQWKQERDEARDVARRYWESYVEGYYAPEQRALAVSIALEQHPWLAEK